MAKKFKVESHSEIRTKVVGVTYENRQEVIRKRVKAGMRLALVPEPDNPFDPLAVAVYVPAGTLKGSAQIGYLMGPRARQVLDLMAAGKKLGVTVSDVTGGKGEKESRGVNVLIVY